MQPRPTKNPLEGNQQAMRNGAAMLHRCAGCHGPDARISRPGSDYWASGGTDDRMFDTVRRGVPGTEMTPADPMRVLDRDIWQILAWQCGR
jgi:mono/diheme cytochrome c family protein